MMTYGSAAGPSGCGPAGLGSGWRRVRREVDSRGVGLAQGPGADWAGAGPRAPLGSPGLPSPPFPWAAAGRSGCWTGSR